MADRVIHRRTDRIGRATACAWVVVCLSLLSVEGWTSERCFTSQGDGSTTSCTGPKLRKTARRRMETLKRLPPRPDLGTIEALTRPAPHFEPVAGDDRASTVALDRVQMALLRRQLGQLERLLELTPPAAADRPALLRRLSNRYLELERAAEHDLQLQERRARRYDTGSDADRVAVLRARATQSRALATAARRGALQHAELLRRDHPGWCRHPGRARGDRGCGDEVLFQLGQLYERDGQQRLALKTHEQLTSRWPQSSHAPRAWLAAGRQYARAAQADPKQWARAVGAYQQAIGHRRRDDRTWATATVQLGYAYWNQGALTEARDAFARVLTLGRHQVLSPWFAELLGTARRNLALVFALEGDPEDAYAYFRLLVPDRSNALGLAESLGRIYWNAGTYPKAVSLYRDLANHSRGGAACGYQARVVEATIAAWPGDKRTTQTELGKLLRHHQQLRQGSSRGRQRCANEAAALLSETAMAWHLEAVGSQGVRGTWDERTMQAAETLYRAVLDNFVADQFDGFSFARIARSDWPSFAAMRYAWAELSFSQAHWERCATAFDELVRHHPQDPHAADAMWGAAICHKRALDERPPTVVGAELGRWPPSGGSLRPKPNPRLAPRALTAAQRSAVAAIDRYLCRFAPPTGAPHALEQYVAIEYARARVLFEAHRWEAAAAAFRHIALELPATSWGVMAGHLHLQSLTVLGKQRQQPRPSCFDDLRDSAAALVGHYCGDPAMVEHEEDCVLFQRLQGAAPRLRAEALRAQCLDGARRETASCQAAGEQYVKLWRTEGSEACRARTERCDGAEQLLYYGAETYERSGAQATAIRLREMLIDPHYHLLDTPLAPPAMLELAQSYERIADYPTAASTYERLVERFPRAGAAPEAWAAGVQLRLRLGQTKQAQAQARKSWARYRRTRPGSTTQVALTMAAHHASRRDWSEVARQLRAAHELPRFTEVAPDLRLRSLALLGRAYRKLGRRRQAEQTYADARQLWHGSGLSRQLLLPEAGKHGAAAAELRQQVLGAAAESLFHVAEQRRRAAETITVPRYRGPATRGGIEGHARRTIEPWQRRRQRATDGATAAYAEVFALPSGPPAARWIVSSAAAVGGMWARFATTLRTTPYPRPWNHPGYVPGSEPPLLFAELRASYQEMLRSRSLPIERIATAACINCLALGQQHSRFEPMVRPCRQWLVRAYPKPR